MREKKFRSSCPISSTLDLFGDKWTLLIVRDLLEYGSRTYKDFSQAEEHISSARLADRLKKLEEIGVLSKNNHPTNKKVFIYELNEKGKDLAPIIVEYFVWGAKHLKEHVSEESQLYADKLKKDRNGILAELMN